MLPRHEDIILNYWASLITFNLINIITYGHYDFLVSDEKKSIVHDIIPCGLVVRIQPSHGCGRGSIPRMGIPF